MKVFFTADTHFGHKAILKHANRPFHSVEEMDDAMIANWNEKVAWNDTVYHLGDFFVYCSLDHANWVRDQLNGRICVIRGNHDQLVDEMSKTTRFRWVKDYYKLKHIDPEPLRVDAPFGAKQHIVMLHYAMRTWQHKRKGVWHLYGHSHGKLPDIPGELSCDIGVDCWGYAPVSYEELKAHFKKKTGLHALHDWNDQGT